MKHIVLEGAKIIDKKSFYNEIHLCIGGNGNNLDALDDMLYGGLHSAYSDGEAVIFIWKDSHISSRRRGSYFKRIVKVFRDHDNIKLILE